MLSFLAKRNILFFILPLYLLLSIFLIYRSSFTIGQTTYYSLVDDQMISMRYAKNLAHGAGLIWNANGERVEGITNLLWALYMAVIHLFPISEAKISLFIQIS